MSDSNFLNIFKPREWCILIFLIENIDRFLPFNAISIETPKDLENMLYLECGFFQSIKFIHHSTKEECLYQISKEVLYKLKNPDIFASCTEYHLNQFSICELGILSLIPANTKILNLQNVIYIPYYDDDVDVIDTLFNIPCYNSLTTLMFECQPEQEILLQLFHNFPNLQEWFMFERSIESSNNIIEGLPNLDTIYIDDLTVLYTTGYPKEDYGDDGSNLSDLSITDGRFEWLKILLRNIKIKKICISNHNFNILISIITQLRPDIIIDQKQPYYND